MGKKEYAISISETLCLGEECGCNRFCTRVFHCPGLVWNKERKTTMHYVQAAVYVRSFARPAPLSERRLYNL
jgi:hypothetical protein